MKPLIGWGLGWLTSSRLNTFGPVNADADAAKTHTTHESTMVATPRFRISFLLDSIGPGGYRLDASSLRVGPIDKEAGMALARVVSFEGVSKDRMEQMKEEMQGERPEGLPATEIIMLHDPDAEQSLAILFFENEDDYRQGDAVLNAMPTDETPGRRASVTRYDVAVRRTD